MKTTTEFWNNIKTAKEFLKELKGCGITMKELKHSVFGKTATQVVTAIRSGGQEAFDYIVKNHMVWYNTKLSITQVIKRLNNSNN